MQKKQNKTNKQKNCSKKSTKQKAGSLKGKIKLTNH